MPDAQHRTFLDYFSFGLPRSPTWISIFDYIFRRQWFWPGCKLTLTLSCMRTNLCKYPVRHPVLTLGQIWLYLPLTGRLGGTVPSEAPRKNLLKQVLYPIFLNFFQFDLSKRK